MKRNFVLLALLVSLFSIGYAANLGISVNSPYLVTQWCIGKNLDINWNKWGDWSQLNLEPGYQYVKILLIKVNSRMRPRVISAKTENDGSFDWVIPSDVLPGEYHVRVVTLNGLQKGESDVFIIKKCRISRM